MHEESTLRQEARDGLQWRGSLCGTVECIRSDVESTAETAAVAFFGEIVRTDGVLKGKWD